MAKPRYNYEPDDQDYLDRHGIPYMQYYAARLKLAKDLGCDCVVDGFKTAYQVTGSLRKASAIFSMTIQPFRKALVRLGVQFNPPGGWHRPYAETVEGSACRSCGSTIRYARSGNCVACMRLSNMRQYLKKKSTRKTESD